MPFIRILSLTKKRAALAAVAAGTARAKIYLVKGRIPDFVLPKWEMVQCNPHEVSRWGLPLEGAADDQKFFTEHCSYADNFSMMSRICNLFNTGGKVLEISKSYCVCQ